MQLTLDFEPTEKKLLWEFDLGAWHFLVHQDERGELWLSSRPVEKKRRRK